MQMSSKQFKKGDKVTRIASYNRTGTVYVRHYVVTSWGKKQATLVRVDDGSNAEFRVYTQTADCLQGVASWRIMATADYTDALGLEIAAEFIADEHKRASARWARAQANFAAGGIPYAGTLESNLKHERGVFADHNAVAWVPAILAK
jgi:hypothetical protein